MINDNTLATLGKELLGMMIKNPDFTLEDIKQVVKHSTDWQEILMNQALVVGIKNRHYSASVHLRDRQEELAKISDLPKLDFELVKYRFLVDEIQRIFNEVKI